MSLESPFQPASAFLVLLARVPKTGAGEGEPWPDLLPSRERPIERGAQVVLLECQAAKRLARRRDLFRERQEGERMCAPRLVDLACLRESLGRILAHGLEQSVA